MKLTLEQMNGLYSQRPEVVIFKGIDGPCQRNVRAWKFRPTEGQVRRKLAVLGLKSKRLHRFLHSLRQSLEPALRVMAAGPDNARSILIWKRSRTMHRQLERSMPHRDRLQSRLDLLDDRFVDVAEKLQREVEIVDLRPRDFHPNVRSFQPRLCLADGDPHIVRNVDGDEGTDHFLRISRRTASSAYCDTKNLKVSRSKART